MRINVGQARDLVELVAMAMRRRHRLELQQAAVRRQAAVLRVQQVLGGLELRHENVAVAAGVHLGRVRVVVRERGLLLEAEQRVDGVEAVGLAVRVLGVVDGGGVVEVGAGRRACD